LYYCIVKQNEFNFKIKIMKNLKAFNIILIIIAIISANLSTAEINDKIFITVFLSIAILFWLSVNTSKNINHSNKL